MKVDEQAGFTEAATTSTEQQQQQPDWAAAAARHWLWRLECKTSTYWVSAMLAGRRGARTALLQLDRAAT